MGIILKHFTRTPQGTYKYRRRVPGDVLTAIGKREFLKVLGDNYDAAVRAYGSFHAVVEAQINSARSKKNKIDAAARGELRGYELFEAAQAHVDEILQGADPEQVGIAASDQILNQYPVDPDYGEPIGINPLEQATVALLNSPGTRPQPTLTDAKQIYLKRRLRGGTGAYEDQARRLNRIFGKVENVLGGMPNISGLKRSQAYKVLDHMLAHRKKNGELIAVNSVKREIAIIKAVINFGIKEFDLPPNTNNPFNGLDFEEEVSAGKERLPFPTDVLNKVHKRIMGHANVELKLIWRLLEGTGCRLAEVTGLRTTDLDLSGELPNMKVEWHEDRRIKNSSSTRHVPLVGDALNAAREAVVIAGQETTLFKSYGKTNGPTNASQALMNHVREITKDPRYVVHSLRHNMKDALVLAEVALYDQNLILGHALGGVGDRVYGGAPAKLRVTTKAMLRALAVREGLTR